MSVNDIKVQQAGTILTAIVKQATGVAPLSVANTAEFVSVAQTALKTGTDPIINALSQMWGRTIFSVRPYTRKFKGMEMNMDRWGNAVRKLSIVDKDIVDDERFLRPLAFTNNSGTIDLHNGESVDMYKLNKPDVLQANFYGQAVYENVYTIFRDNLDVAFSSPEEFMRFNAAVAQNRSDKLEQYRENIARSLLTNFIGAIHIEDDVARNVHLVTEYNTATGLSLTPATVLQPDNFAPFIKWAYARINTLVKMMSERSELYQTVIGGKHVIRHTPANDVMCYMRTTLMEQIKSMVLSSTYHDDMLKLVNFEEVNFWQSIESPDDINVTAAYTNTSGAAVSSATQINNVVGVLFDRDALGYAQVNAWNALTPFNAAGGYWNDYDHVNFRALQDMSEKAIVLTLD